MIKVIVQGSANALKKLRENNDKAIKKAIDSIIKKQTLRCRILLTIQSLWYKILKNRR